MWQTHPCLPLVLSDAACTVYVRSHSSWPRRTDDITQAVIVLIARLNAAMTHWSCIYIPGRQNVRNAGRETQVDNDNPRRTLIWSMRPDPDIVAICHVAMSASRLRAAGPTFIRITSGLGDSVSSLRCFFMAMVSVYLSLLSFTSHLSSALLCTLSLPDPGPSSQACRVGDLRSCLRHLSTVLSVQGFPVPPALPLFSHRALPTRPCSPPL